MRKLDSMIIYRSGILVVCTFLLMGCASQIKYSDRMFSESPLKNQEVVFVLTSNIQVVPLLKDGPSIGRLKAPDNKAAYTRSICDLRKELNLNLKLGDSSTITNPSRINVIAEIKEIRWTFTLSTATMKTVLSYRIVGEDQTYNIVGIYKNNSGGSEEKNLYESLKNANYLFLKEIENR